MRLWHYKIIPYLPDKQLKAQWRELNAIFVNEPKHILINYVYEYRKQDLYTYSQLVIEEMKNRGFNRSLYNFNFYFKNAGFLSDYYEHPFKEHHNNRYLLQCFYNLQEKYDRGQEGFTKEQYDKLEEFIKNEIH